MKSTQQNNVENVRVSVRFTYVKKSASRYTLIFFFLISWLAIFKVWWLKESNMIFHCRVNRDEHQRNKVGSRVKMGRSFLQLPTGRNEEEEDSEQFRRNLIILTQSR